jgi:hypothetical protein
MKLLNNVTPVTRRVIPQILLNVQDFYFLKVGYTSYDEGIFGRYTDLRHVIVIASDQRTYLHITYKIGRAHV